VKTRRQKSFDRGELLDAGDASIGERIRDQQHVEIGVRTRGAATHRSEYDEGHEAFAVDTPSKCGHVGQQAVEVLAEGTGHLAAYLSTFAGI
jgi:hypothetical protein